MSAAASLNQQIAEIDRELAARRTDPRRFARAAGLREREADYCTACLESARDTLMALQRGERSLPSGSGAKP